MQETVVLIHGIWMKGLEMNLLRRHLRHCGYRCERFTYQSLHHTPGENAMVLNQFLHQISSPVIHFVAHSLGGIVLLHLFDQFPQQKPGRVVMLGTPLHGSDVAQYLYRKRFLRWLIGHSAERGLLGETPSWKGDRELGVIAGYRGIGMGKLLTRGHLSEPNDGTVTVHETEATGITEHVLVPHSHFGMLFSREVGKMVCRFLRSGHFNSR